MKIIGGVLIQLFVFDSVTGGYKVFLEPIKADKLEIFITVFVI